MINNTNLLTGAEARKKIKVAVNKIYNTVKLTLGPEGKNAILPRTYNRGARISNDGINIADNARMFQDPHERLIAEAFVEGSKKTNELVGDGTTATAVIAGVLFNDISHDMESENVNVIGQKANKKGVRALRQELNELKAKVIEEIKSQAKPIKTLADLEKIAIISIGKEDEKMAKIIAGMVWQVARDNQGQYIDNHIDVVEGYKGEIETEVIQGHRFPAKVAHKAFVNNPDRFEMIIEDTPVIITNTKIESWGVIDEMVERTKMKKCTIFATGFSNSVIAVLANTMQKGAVQIYPVLCPALRTEQMEDLATYIGAKVIDKSKGETLEAITPEHIGYAGKIVVRDTENKEDAILTGGKGKKEEISKRALTLKKQKVEAKNDLLKIQLDRRIANLNSSVGVIRVGATTNNEALFLKLKIEDGVYACKAALEEGYVQGGGLCLKNIAKKLGKSIITNALNAPYNQIQENAGEIEIGKDVIDPAKVIRLEVEHGVSVATMLLTCDISIAEVQEKNEYDGMHEVGKALEKLAFYFGKHHSLIKENEDVEKKMMNDEFERVTEMDN
jgi:chaperonin GroEL